MSFYDSERIKRKNDKFGNQKAIDIVHKLETMGYTDEELLVELEKLIDDAKTESQQAFLKKAIELTRAKQKAEKENPIEKSFEFVDGHVVKAVAVSPVDS